MFPFSTPGQSHKNQTKVNKTERINFTVFLNVFFDCVRNVITSKEPINFSPTSATLILKQLWIIFFQWIPALEVAGNLKNTYFVEGAFIGERIGIFRLEWTVKNKVDNHMIIILCTFTCDVFRFLNSDWVETLVCWR